jgi:NitT/TauT family transport system ATP-binding protein
VAPYLVDNRCRVVLLLFVVLHDGRVVDDLAVAALRPRTTDSLLLPEMVAIKHTLLAHLGLEQDAKKPAAAGAAA